MDWSKQDLLRTSKEIIADLGLTTSELDSKYSIFKEKFPKIYEQIKSNEPGFISELEHFLGIREDLKNGLVTEIDANVQASEHVAKKYVYPIIGTPTEEQKKTALKKIIREHKKNME
jgi:hypothetical protein